MEGSDAIRIGFVWKGASLGKYAQHVDGFVNPRALVAGAWNAMMTGSLTAFAKRASGALLPGPVTTSRHQQTMAWI